MSVQDARTYYLQLLDGTAKESTVKPRAYFLASFTKNVNDLLDSKTVMERINQSDNPGTRWKNLMHVLAALEAADLPKTNYDDVKQKMYEEALANTRDTTKTKKQVDRFRPLPELQQILLNELKTKPLSRELVALACYVLQPAIRNDWFDMRVTNKKSDTKNGGNWLHKTSRNKMTLIMQDYKNAFAFGRREIPITKELSPWLRMWLNTGDERDRVFRNMSDNVFGKMLARASKNVFGQPLTINDFRHIWEIHFQTDPKYATMSVADKDKLHAQLLHSTEAAMLYNTV